MPTKLIFCSVFTSHYSKLLPLEQSLYLTKYSVKHEQISQERPLRSTRLLSVR